MSASPSFSARPNPGPSLTLKPPTSAPTTKPPTSPPAPAPTATVYAVGVSLTQTAGLRAAAAGSGQATVRIKASGTGTVKVTVQWFTGDEGNPFASPDGSQVLAYTPGGTLPPVAHTFKGEGCYWAVRVTTSPAAAEGPATDTLLQGRCVPA